MQDKSNTQDKPNLLVINVSDKVKLAEEESVDRPLNQIQNSVDLHPMDSEINHAVMSNAGDTLENNDNSKASPLGKKGKSTNEDHIISVDDNNSAKKASYVTTGHVVET